MVKTQRGFAVKCLLCGEDGTVRIDAHDVDSFSCTSCENTFTTDEVKAELGRWTTLLLWLDTAPRMEA
jgi:transposase-like protein